MAGRSTTRSTGIATLGAMPVFLLAELPSIRFVRRLELPAVVREMFGLVKGRCSQPRTPTA